MQRLVSNKRKVHWYEKTLEDRDVDQKHYVQALLLGGVCTIQQHDQSL